jgi:ABC-type uncharacterized transport system substrate-binding protein
MKLVTLVRAVIVFIAMPIVFSYSASAHPHVWVNVETELMVGPNQQITGFRHKWTFDELYSEFAIQGLDTNGDGVYSEEELKPLAQTNVEALKEFEYFTFAFLGKTKLALNEPLTDYRLVYKDKLLTLYFTLPLVMPVSREKIREFNFSIYDPGMYVAMTFDKKAPVTIASAVPMPCNIHVGDRTPAQQAGLSKLGENIDPSSNVSSQFAESVTIDCK